MNTEKSKKEQNGKYNFESLEMINSRYCTKYKVTQDDVNMVNTYVALIENTRSNTIPKAGDVVRYTNQHGDYYPYAHINENCNGVCNICGESSVPFIKPYKEEISCNTSGGQWNNLETSSLKFIGTEQKHFKDWGHLGACADGSVHFTAEVSIWEYVHPEPLYKDYTTKNWRKFYISRISEDERQNYGGYLYKSMDGIAFQTESEFHQFLSDFKGEIFSGNRSNQYVIWCYKEQQERISQEEFDALNLPKTSIYCNGKRPAKVKYDDENKTAIMYFAMSDTYIC